MAITGSVDLGDGLQAVTVDHDPTSTTTDVPAGSIIIDASGNHFRKIDSGATTNVTESTLKQSLAETTNPGTGDDNTADYAVGSHWVNVSTDEAFIAVDVSTGAAVWKSLTAATGLPVPDTTSIVEGSADATKEMRIEVDGLTAATVRVLTMPDGDITPVNFAGQLGGTALIPDVRGVRETVGPTLLTMGAVLDGQGFIRDGASIVGFNFFYVKTTDNLVSLLGSASSGDTFILESGTHDISSPILITSLFNISILGVRGSIIRGTGGAIGAMMRLSAANGLRLEGFTFEARTGDGNAIEVIAACNEVVVRDIMFIKEGTTLAGNCFEFALGDGVDAFNWTISGCFASQGNGVNNWDNFITTDATTSILQFFKVLNNSVTSTSILANSGGIRFLTSGGLRHSIIHGNNFQNLDIVGIQIQAGQNNIISNNYVRIGINFGLNIKSDDTTIEGNEVDDASIIGISIEGENCVCDGNRTNDCGTAIVIREGAARSVISNNIIVGGSGHDGIELRSGGAGVGDEHRIIGNTISGTDRGIELQDGEDVVIAGNSILNLFAGASPLGVGIWLSGTEVRRVQIRDNYIEPNKEGILDESDNGFHTFQHNEIRGGTIGILVPSGFNGDGLVIKSNKLVTQSDSPIGIFFDADGPIVTENIIRGSTVTGTILLLKRNSIGVTKLQVNDNIITGCASATRCIVIDASDGAQVNDNRIANNGGDGINIISSDDCSISHNHITDQTGDGIDITSDSNGARVVGNFFKNITGTELNLLGTGRVASTRTVTGSQDVDVSLGDLDINIVAEKDMNRIDRAWFWISQNGFDLGANTEQPVKLSFFAKDTFLHTIDNADPNTDGLVAELVEFHFVVQDLETAIIISTNDVNIDDTDLYSAGLLIRIVDSSFHEFQRLETIDTATDMTIIDITKRAYGLNNDVALVLEVPGFAYRDRDETGEIHLRISPGDTVGADIRLHWLIEYEIDN